MSNPWREAALDDINTERDRQIVKWGPQHHENGTGLGAWLNQTRGIESLLRVSRHDNDHGSSTWATILAEEFAEALLERDKRELEIELIQVAAVCVAWVEDLNGREP